MTQKQLPLNHPRWARELERSAALRHMDNRGPDLSARLSRARMVNLKARETRWHWIALSFVCVLVMVEI